ncbi:MAG: DUF2490 domain-containing protein [Ginsengibacter sp.]
MKSLSTLIYVLAIGLPTITNAQNKNIKKISQQWTQYYSQTKLSEKWIWSADAGFRYNKMLNDPSQYILRTGLNYGLNKHMKVAVGFAHLGFYSSRKLSKVEYRPYQEFAILYTYQHLGISHRFRVEERFFNEVAGGNSSNANSFNFRFRYQFLLNIELFKFSSPNLYPSLFLNLGDEIFLNAGKDVTYNVFDQNRLVIGPSVSLSKKIAIAINYNHQFAAVNSPNTYVRTNVLWFIVRQNFSLSNQANQQHNE